MSAPHRPSLATHTPDRQVALEVQGSPLRSPHTPSTSQMPLRQVSAERQFPPFGFPHSPSELHTPLRQTDAELHARELGSPHRLSLTSHTPLEHTRAPVPEPPVVQTPLSGELPGIGWPLAILEAHTPAPDAPLELSHHWLGQSESTVHWVPHTPLLALQIVPPWEAPAQSAFEAHLEQAPLGAQKESVAVGQAAEPLIPLSTVQPVQVVVDAAQMGVVPVHAVAFVAVHWTQRSMAELHAGVEPEQFVSDEQMTHLPALVPPLMHKPLRHCILEVHVPSPRAIPHELSLTSQTPLEQIAAPTAAVHVPASAGT